MSPVLPPEALEAVVTALLRERLLTVTGLPALRQWEGELFERPATPAPYLRETMLLDDGPDRQTLGEQPWVKLGGLWQIDLFRPKRQGALAALRLLGAEVRAVFPDTLTLTRTDAHVRGTRTVTLRTESVAVASALTDDPAYIQLPVTLTWTADAIMPWVQ